MKDFVISDIHGCYLTLMKLLHRHYDESSMRLVLLGDYLDKGRYAFEVWRWLFEKANDGKTILLRGNHEQELIEYINQECVTCWYEQDGQVMIDRLKANKVSIQSVYDLFNRLPLYYETGQVFYSHAGSSIFKHDQDNPNDPCGLLWNRMPVENLGKLQVYGHTPHLTGPIFQAYSQSYVIDTGVFLNGYLSALIIDESGTVLAIHKEKTDPHDIKRREKII